MEYSVPFHSVPGLATTAGLFTGYPIVGNFCEGQIFSVVVIQSITIISLFTYEIFCLFIFLMCQGGALEFNFFKLGLFEDKIKKI